jgi:preprotein translocase subunit YajC
MEFAVITGLVTLMGKWLNYDIEKRKLEQAGESAPQTDEETQKGKQVAEVVETGIQQHGGTDEQTALAGFRQNPQMFASVLEQAMKNLADREPAFAQQLQDVAKQTNVVQSGGIHGTAEVKGNNTGINIGANTGNVSQSNQTINNQSSNKGAQGTFHGPVNFGKDEK